MSADNTARIAILLDGAQARTEAKATSAELSGIGAAAKAAGVSATAGLSQVDTATQQVATGTTSLGVRQIELQNDLKRVRAEIAGYAANLQSLNSLTPRTAAAQAQLNLEIKQETAVLEELIGIQAEYKSELAQVNTALREHTVVVAEIAPTALASARAEQDLALAQTEVAATGNVSTSTAIRGAVAFDRLAGVSVGAGRSLSILATLFNGASLAQFAVIIGIGFLIGKLIELARTTEEQIKLDQEQIALDARRHDALNTGTLFTREYVNVLRDRNALNAQLKQSDAEVASAQANEADAVRGSTNAYKEAAAASTDLQSKIATYVVGLFHSTGAQTEETAKRIEATKKNEEHIQSLIKMAAQTGQTAQALIAERIAAGATTAEIERLTQALNTGALAQTRYRLGQGIKREIQEQVAQEAAARGEVLKHGEAEQRYTEALKGRGDATVKLAQEAELATKNMKAFHDEHIRGVGAARAHALAENSLTRELKDAQAALIGDSFAARDQKITNDVAAEREALRIKKELNALAITQLVDLEKAKHQKVAQDRKLAEQRLMDELQVMQIAGMAGELDRERATLALRLRQRVEEIHKELGFTVEATELVNAFRKAEEEALARWTLDRHQKLSDELGKIGLEALRREGAAYEKQVSTNLKFEEEAFKKHEAEMENLKKHLGGIQAKGRDGISVPDVNVLSRDIDLLKKLEISVSDVDKQFGSASRSTLQWQTRLEILAKAAGIAGAANVSLIDNLKQLIDWQHIFTEAINLTIQAISGAIAGTDNMGKALLVGFLRIVAEIAATLGTLFLLAAAGFIALPGFQWTAGQLFAAGAALIAFAGIVGGVAQLIENKGKQNSAGASTASGAAATPATQRQGAGPNIVPFPTSPTIVAVRLDSRGTKALLEGQEVVTMSDHRGTGKNTPELRKRIGKWSQSSAF